MTLAGFTFARPMWLAVGVALALGTLVLAVLSSRRRKAALASFGPRHVSSMSASLRGMKHVFVALALLFGCAALARPVRRPDNSLLRVDTAPAMRRFISSLL